MNKIQNLEKTKWNLWVRKNESGEIIEIAEWTWKGKPPGEWQGKHRSIPWEEVTPFMFEATVKPNGFSKGRSAINFHFDDINNGMRYPMSASGMSELLDAIVRGCVKVDQSDGTLSIILKWAKKGTAYSVDPVLS